LATFDADAGGGKLPPKRLLFLGAGASAPLDYPTTAQFKSKLGQETNDEDLKSILSSGEFKDIEEVLLIFDQLATFQQVPQALHFLTTFWSTQINTGKYSLRPDKDLVPHVLRLREIVRGAVFRYYEPDPRFDKLLLNLHGRLVDFFTFDPSKDGTAIVTTNYDMAVERLGKLAGKTVRDGFDGDPNSQTGKWNPIRIFGSFEDVGIDLLKLHGSLNWRVERDTGNLVRVPITERVPVNSRQYSENVLIYPASKGVPKDEPFTTLFKMLEKLLSDVHSCFVIGYRFRDDVVNSYISRFLQSKGKSLYVLSPSASTDVKENLRPIGGGADIVPIDDYFRPTTEKTWKGIVTSISFEEAPLLGLTRQGVVKIMDSR
jgi:hypothetical protein